MIPRSVVLQNFSRNRVQYSSTYYTPWTDAVSSAALSQLSDILSDNVKRPRPVAPLGLVKSRQNKLKTNFVRDPKNHSYTKRLLKYANGKFDYVLSTDPATYPRYWQEGGLFSLPSQRLVTFGSPDLLERADKRIKSKFFNKLKNTQLDLAITLAERSKTKVMIAHRAALLINLKSFVKGFYKRVRQRSIRQHESIAKAMANAWLEFVYGWCQLAQDIFAIASFAASREQSRYVRLRGETGEDRNFSFTSGDSGIRQVVTEERRVFSEMKIKLTVTADPVLDLTRLTTLNPVAIAWELLPFSFVFDWILNISTYLSELQTRAMFSCSLGKGYITHTEVYRLRGAIPAQTTKGSFYCVNVPGEIRYSDTWTKKNRVVFNTAPMPSFPTLKCPVSIEHALTTLSLVTQRLSSKNLGRKGRFQ